ncbi:MAG: stage 0 sporulation protein [Chloroflexi bacterium]|nr:stage 0 sporulation protein [Chloroflexota bacterium]
MSEMVTSSSSQVVGVRFSNVGKIYNFDSGEIRDLLVGDAVIVETSQGWQIGFVTNLLDANKVEDSKNLKSITRKASPRDLIVRQTWQQKENEVVEYSRKKVGDLKLVGIKIIGAEYSFDGKRLLVFYNFDGEGGGEVKSLRNDLQKRYSSTKLDLRPLGPRDVAKLYCGLGACGKEKRCCCAFLSEFSSISIRMAKNQSISLTPIEITGMCGRLRCCLEYEDKNYSEALQGLPKKGKRIMTPSGEGRVVEIRALSEEVVIDLREAGKKIYTKEEIKNFPK